MLLGIVKKKAIIQIEFALDAQRAGRPRRRSTRAASCGSARS